MTNLVPVRANFSSNRRGTTQRNVPLGDRIGIIENVFPQEFFSLAQKDVVSFVHSIKEDMFCKIDAPVCSNSPLFWEIFEMVAGQSFFAKKVGNAIYTMDKYAAKLVDAINIVSHLMPRIGRVLLWWDVLNNVSILIDNDFQTKVVDTDSLRLYVVDGNSLLHKSIDRVEIGLVLPQMTLAIISNETLGLNPLILPRKYENSTTAGDYENLADENADFCDVDAVTFIPPPSRVHPALNGFLPAINSIQKYLEEISGGKINAFLDEGCLKMYWHDVHNAMQLFENYIPPFSVLKLKHNISGSSVAMLQIKLRLADCHVDARRGLIIISSEKEAEARKILKDFITDEDEDVFGCLLCCSSPELSSCNIIKYGSVQEGKPICLACLETWLDNDFYSERGISRMRTKPVDLSSNYLENIVIGQLSLSLQREPSRAFKKLMRWADIVKLSTIYNMPEKFYYCNTHYKTIGTDNRCLACWICQKTFETGKQCYAHLEKDHNGYYN